MAIIQKEIKLFGSKGEAKVIALFDSTSTYSCIRKELAKKLGLIDLLPKPLQLVTAEEGKFFDCQRGYSSRIFFKWIRIF